MCFLVIHIISYVYQVIQLRLTLRELYYDKIFDDKISRDEISDDEFSVDELSGYQVKRLIKKLAQQQQQKMSKF